jgi:hypothetical protein
MIALNVLLKLVRGGGNRREVSGDLAGAVVRITYSPASERVIACGLTGTGVAVEVFKNGVVDAVTRTVRNEPNISLGRGADVVPGTDGKINPEIQLSNLQMRCVGHPDRNRQALTLLGNLFAATEHNGNRVDKRETAIRPGQDFATTFSLPAVHSFIFCPSVAASLTQRLGRPVAIGDLPTSCGSGHAVSVDDVRIRSLLDTYADEAIHVFGTMEKSADCYEATGSFRARIEMAVAPDGRSLTYKTTVDEPDVDVSVDWYCQIAVVVLLGYFSLAVVAAMEDLAADFAVSVAKSILTKDLLSGLSPAGQGAENGVKLTSVSITRDGLTLQGLIDIPVPYVDSTRFISIVVVDATEEVTGAAQGDWMTTLSCKPATSYTYTETQQRQTRTYDLKAQLVATPLSVTYFVRGAVRGIGDLPAPSGTPIQLLPPGPISVVSGGGWRSVTVPNVECMYPLPLGTGGTKVTQDVHLDYLVSGTHVQIANRQPGEGNFFILLEGSVLDVTGSAPAGVAKPALWILFDGDTVTMGDDYLADQRECALKGLGNIPRNYIPGWKFEFDPSPSWQMFAQVRALKEMELRGELPSGETEMLLLQAQVALGDSVTRAFRASNGIKGQHPLPDASATLRAIAGELRSQVRTLTDRLAEVERARNGIGQVRTSAFVRDVPR